MRHVGKLALAFTATVLAAGPVLAVSHWVPLGPFGGSIETLTVDPTDARVIYANLGAQGAFKSADGGATWSCLLAGDTYGSIAVDSAQPGTVYLVADRVFKSIDGGRAWTAVESLGYGAVQTIAVDPVIPSRVYAGTRYAGVLRSTDRGASWNPASIPLPATASSVRAVVPSRPPGRVFALSGGGLFKSTDGGLSWLPSGEGLPAGEPLALAVDPADARKVYVSLRAGIFRSRDGGDSWAQTKGQPVESGAVLALAVSAQGIWAGAEPGGLFRSTDGGAHWSVAGPNRRVTAVAVAPTSPRTVYLGTTAQSSFLGGIFASTDGGASWVRSNRRLTGIAVESLEPNPAIPGWLWIGASTQGLLQSHDGGRSWTRAPLKVPASSNLGLASSPADPLLLYAFISPRLWQTLDGGLSWSEILSPPGSPGPTGLRSLWADPVDPLKLWGTLGNRLLVSRDAGATWRGVKNPIESCCVVGGLAFAPSSPSILYLGGSRNSVLPLCRYQKPVVGRSTDGGATWTAADLPAYGAVARLLAVDTVDPQLVYAATSGDLFNPPGGLRKSEDGGITWSESGGLIGMYYWRISALAAPRPRVVWVVQDDYPGQRIFSSGDAGETWQERENLLARTVYKLAGDPTDPRRIYAATSNGVWVLTDPE